MKNTVSTRRCTMCGDVFHEHAKPGRPSAFCSDACRQLGKETKERVCTICSKPFNMQDANPYYCSNECQAARHLCDNPECLRPTTTKFCSIQCLQAINPPPYPCKQCGKQFTPSNKWLNTVNALRAVPDYCTSRCWRLSKGMPPVGNYKMLGELNNVRQDMYVMTGRVPIVNNRPWTEIPPTITLHEVDRYSVEFWRHVLEHKQDLLPMELIEQYMFYGMLVRGIGETVPGGISSALHTWPWITHDLDLEFDERRVLSMYNAHVHHFDAKRRSYKAKTPDAMRELIMGCHDAFRAWQGIANAQFDLEPKLQNFAYKWMKPDDRMMGQTKLELSNNHLQYSLTWFTLAIAGLVIFGLWVRRTLSAPNEVKP